MSAHELLLALLAAVLKAGVLVGLAAVPVAALRRASARARHGIWAGALIGALLLPVLSPWLPEWSIAALPVPDLASARPGRPDPVRVPLASMAPEREPGAPLPVASRSQGTVGSRGVASPGLAFWSPGLSPAAWLLALWLLGCLVSLAAFLRDLRAARRLARRGAAPPAPWRRDLAEAHRQVGLRRPVDLLVSTEVATPMTWGLLRPVILLPAASAGWSRERRRIVLLHELVHVRRADWLVRLAGRVVCSVYWLNPIVWAAARRLAIEQEIACDEEVVALGARPSSYARHLLAIARSLGPAGAAPAHALDMARRSQMEGRLMSILDGGHRLRGGGKLALLALMLIAGLVPALAAIEPWVQEPDAPALSRIDAGAGGVPAAGTEGVARVLGELQGLARRMEPFEAELEGLEAEMEPIQRELEEIEVEMEPIAAELEGFEVEMGPFETSMAAIEAEIGPYERLLEAIEVEIEPFEERLELTEAEMRPFEEHLARLEVEMRPFEERLEAIEVEMQPFEEELERLSEQMEPLAADGARSPEELERLAAQMRDMHLRMEPLHERMAAVHEEMEPIFERMAEAHREMEPVHERMAEIHEEMAPVFERMAAVHEEMEPVHERMAAIHEVMEPVHERMGAVHERMSPYHQQMGERHQRMEPYRRKMAEIHERMQPLHEELGRRHEELERELAGVVERLLATELAGVTGAGTDYAPTARRVVDAVSLRVDDGTLRIMSSTREVRELVGEGLRAQSTVAGPQFDAAVERFVRALGDLEVAAR